MSKVNYHVLNNSVIVNYEGKTFNVNKGDGRYREVLNCIREGRLEDIPDALDVEKFFHKAGLTLVDGVIHIDNEPLPKALSDRVIAFRDEGLPTEPLFKFWENLKKNPSLNSRKMLYKFLEHNGHPLTEDGCFIAYRGINNDFTDLHTGTMNNSIGSIVEMPREEVDDNPNNLCSNGLHVACHEYADSFGKKLIEVSVNPADVVCVPEDYDGTKMRVCRFEVINECEKLRDESLYGIERTSDHYELDMQDYEEEEDFPGVWENYGFNFWDSDEDDQD